MSVLERTKSLLRTHRSLPKKSLGQNFMVEPSICELMVDCASLDKSDIVLDIGAGLGFLTRLTAGRCKKVLAVETDEQLANILREQLSDVPNVEIIEGDVLQVDVPRFDKIVSTPPYQISSRLVLWMLDRSFDCGVLVFQKEFAERLSARIGTENYGWLTVLTYYQAKVELLDNVPKSMFYPRPDVDSVIVRLTPRRVQMDGLKNGVAFRRLVQSLFTQRNRKVRTAILPFLRGIRGLSKGDVAGVVDGLSFREKRVRDLAPEDFGVLADELNE